MRRLYLIPIIHMSADMGSIGQTLEDRGTAKLKPELWQRHKEVISAFWDSISRSLEGLGVKGFKVYQDGLVADGAEGLVIVREGITQGSKNFEIIGRLLEKGALLVKTESLSLVKQEYACITKMVRSKSLKEKEVAALRYKLVRGKLLKQRDEFIAGRINDTLAEGETGILFIGAYHDIITRLPVSIDTVQVKEINYVREYYKQIVSHNVNSEKIRQLADYLISPVPDTLFR